MDEKYKNVPIKAAKNIASEYQKDMVIIVCFDHTHGKQHITTYGKTIDDCDRAASGGNEIKRLLGWPEKLCLEEPSRVKKLKARIAELETKQEGLK